ncbi:hypothetical protein ACH4U6_33735 [Streptomyces netropsis]|uniref:hypothetical protein n=1 Tax=Streptomyces netropsis TaxID=55404 RepID=UPI0037A3B98E
MARRAARGLASAAVALGGVLAGASGAAADTAPLINAQCVGQGLLVAPFDSGSRHGDRYECSSTEGAVVLDASRTLQGALITVFSPGQRSTRVFR